MCHVVSCASELLWHMWLPQQKGAVKICKCSVDKGKKFPLGKEG